MMKFKGVVAILDGIPDRDGDSFSPNLKINFPNEIPLTNATTSLTIGRVTAILMTETGGRKLVVEGDINEDHEKFYARACNENQGLFLGLNGVVRNETYPIISGHPTKRIEEMSLLSVQLGFKNADTRVPQVDLEISVQARDDKQFRLAYDEAYGTRDARQLTLNGPEKSFSMGCGIKTNLVRRPVPTLAERITAPINPCREISLPKMRIEEKAAEQVLEWIRNNDDSVRLALKATKEGMGFMGLVHALDRLQRAGKITFTSAPSGGWKAVTVPACEAANYAAHVNECDVAQAPKTNIRW